MLATQNGNVPRPGLVWVLLAVLGALLVNPATLYAHGGGRPQLSGAEAGPYRLYAWTSPDPWRVGQVHIDVAVAMPAGDRAEIPVIDALVEVRVQHTEASSEINRVATPLEYLNSFYYETDFELPQDGRWQVEIEVQSEQGAGAAGFSIEAQPPRTVNWLLILGGGGTLLLTVVLWAMWSRPNPPSRPAAARSPRRA